MSISWVFYGFSHMIICLLWFCHRFPNGEIVRTYVFHLLGTYVNILCNWLILWQNTLYLYLRRSRMFLILQETIFQDQVLKPSSLSKKTSWKCKFIKAWQLAQQLHLSSLRKLFWPSVLYTCSTPPICWGLRILEFCYDFLGICECVFGLSFLLTLDI